MRRVAVNSLAASAIGLGFVGPAHAEPRPTDNVGVWSYDQADVIEHLDADDGSIRVHYSSAGPNAADLDDVDEDGVPDYVQLVLDVAITSREILVDELGFRRPVPEADLGLELGGSSGFDVYLVDFGGAADGRFGTDGCTVAPEHCVGFLVVENDFSGYGYASLQEAADTVVSHEFFHAIQAAYSPLPVWASEGGATWAERRIREDSRDFLRFCDALLDDHERSLFKPPLGPVPGFAYGSALWWEFLSAEHGTSTMHAMLEAAETRPDDVDVLEEVMVDVLTDADIDVAETWTAFVQANLATGARASDRWGHAFADGLGGIEADASGAQLDVDARLYPLAASYWRLDHAGGPLFTASDDVLADARLSLHPADGTDGPVGTAVHAWSPDGTLVDLGDREAGTYWIVATLPVLADGSARARVCVGGPDVEQCVAPVDTDGESSSTDGESSSGGADGSTSSDDGDDDHDGDGVVDTGDTTQGDPSAEPHTDSDGCGCSATSGSPLAWLVPVLCGMRPRRRRRVFP